MRGSTSVLAATAAVLVGFCSVAAIPASAAPPKCSDLKGAIVGQNCVIQEADTGYNLSITYPANYPDVQAVFDWVKQTRDGFVNVAKGTDARTQPYQLEVTATEFDSAVPPRGTQSVVFKVFQDVGGTKPQTFYKAFNWDQTLRWPIVLDTGGREKTQPLFQPGTNPWPIIFPLVQAELEKQMGTTAGNRTRGRTEPGDLRELRDPERHAGLLLRPGRDPAGVGRRLAGFHPARARRPDDRLAVKRERSRTPARRSSKRRPGGRGRWTPPPAIRSPPAADSC